MHMHRKIFYFLLKKTADGCAASLHYAWAWSRDIESWLMCIVLLLGPSRPHLPFVLFYTHRRMCVCVYLCVCAYVCVLCRYTICVFYHNTQAPGVNRMSVASKLNPALLASPPPPPSCLSESAQYVLSPPET